MVDDMFLQDIFGIYRNTYEAIFETGEDNDPLPITLLSPGPGWFY